MEGLTSNGAVALESGAVSRILWLPSTDERDLLQLIINDFNAQTSVIPSLNARAFGNDSARRLFESCCTIWKDATTYASLTTSALMDFCRQQADEADQGDECELWRECEEIVRDELDTLPPGTRNPLKEAETIAKRLNAQFVQSRRFIIQSAQTVKTFEPPSALLDGILFENTGAELCGGAASFKTFIALGWAEAIASGHRWNGRATKKTPVIYITGEGRGGLGRRIEALEAFHRRPCEVHFITEAVQLHQPAEVEALLAAIASQSERPGLIVVDTLARCFVGGDENSARDAGLFVAGADRIRAATGATLLVLHHLNKSGGERGSTAFTGAFDTVVEAKRENTTVTLRCIKQKDAPDFEPVSLARRIMDLEQRDDNGRDITSLVFEATDTPPTKPSRADVTREQVLAVLRDLCGTMPEGASAGRWKVESIAATGISEATFNRKLAELKEARAVTFNGSRYSIPVKNKVDSHLVSKGINDSK